MKILSKIIIPVLLFAILRCKKDKLQGDNKTLIGSWSSISTVLNCGTIPGTPSNPEYELVMMEKGNYQLFRNGKRLEAGQLLLIDDFVTFKCREKSSKLNDRKILRFNSDSLNIDRDICREDFQFKFVKM